MPEAKAPPWYRLSHDAHAAVIRRKLEETGLMFDMFHTAWREVVLTVRLPTLCAVHPVLIPPTLPVAPP